MHRRQLLNLLENYIARYPAEQAVAEQIVALVESHEDCFDRTCRPGHITGSAWVLSHDRQRCLLLHHKKLDRWMQPGGHADGDTDVAAVALKEAQEESGIENLTLLGVGQLKSEPPLPLDIDIHIIPARYAADGSLIEDAHEHHDIRFLLAAKDESPIVVSHESHDVRWFTPTEVEQQSDEESVLRLLRKSSELTR